MRGVALAGLVIAVGCSSATSATDAAPAPAYAGGRAPSGTDESGPDGTFSGPPDGITFAPPDCPPATAPLPVDDTAGRTPAVLVRGQSQPWALALDLDHVYWVNGGSTGGGVFKAPKSGGPAVALYEGVLGEIDSIGLDATSIYVPMLFDGAGSIAAIPIDGSGPPRVLATGVRSTRSVGVAGGNVYWIEAPLQFSAPTGKRVSIDGGPVTTFTVPVAALPSGAGYFMALGPDGIYTSFTGDSTIDHIPMDGSKVTGITHPGDGRALAVDADRIFFATGASNMAVGSVPKAGGCPTALVDVLPNPLGLAVDDTTVYFTNDLSAGTVNAVAKSGGVPKTLAKDQGHPASIVVDATTVFWANLDDGTINSVAK